MALRLAAATVATVGLGIAGYLTAAHYDGDAPVCAIAHGCAIVQQSEYAELAGVPVALLGVIGYAAILFTLLRDDEAARGATAFLALAGAGFSGWLTYVEVLQVTSRTSAHDSGVANGMAAGQPNRRAAGIGLRAARPGLARVLDGSPRPKIPLPDRTARQAGAGVADGQRRRVATEDDLGVGVVAVRDTGEVVGSRVHDRAAVRVEQLPASANRSVLNRSSPDPSSFTSSGGMSPA